MKMTMMNVALKAGAMMTGKKKTKAMFCDSMGREYSPPSFGKKVRMLPETWRDWYKGHKVSIRAALLLLYTWLRLFFSPRRKDMTLFMYTDPTGKMTMKELRRMEVNAAWNSQENRNLKALLDCPAFKVHVDALKSEGKIEEWHTLGMIQDMVNERRFGNLDLSFKAGEDNA